MRRDGDLGLHAVRNFKFGNGLLTVDFVEQLEHTYSRWKAPMSKTGSYIGGHTVWTKDDLLTEKDRAKAARKAAHKAARKGNKAAREAKQREAERANDRLAAAAGRALIKAEAEAEAAKAKGPQLELRRITGPDGRKVTIRVWR